jgi:hypothetical protein
MSDRAIITAIQKMAGTFREDKVSMYIGTVESIQGNACTCRVDDEMEMPNIQLQAGVCDGWLLIPAIGSTVVILKSMQNDAFVALYSDVESAYLQAGNGSIEILSDGSVTLNDGSLGGITKGIELVQKLNNLENKVNALISNFNMHTHSGVTTGPGASGPTLTPISGTLTPTNVTEISNLKITHGI